MGDVPRDRFHAPGMAEDQLMPNLTVTFDSAIPPSSK